MSVPNTPTATVTAINPTNATIMITVPSIAYTNETYHILYTGQERDTDLAQSNTVSGTEDIIAINSTYTITLSGLEEDTTYNYTVIASNCIGSTSTATTSLRTSLVPGKIMKHHVTFSIQNAFSFIALNVSVSLNNMGLPLIAGATSSLLCLVESNTGPVTITWTRNGSPVDTSNSRVIVTMTQSNSTLTINPLHTSDGGQYQCIGTIVNNTNTISTDVIDLNITSE